MSLINVDIKNIPFFDLYPLPSEYYLLHKVMFQCGLAQHPFFEKGFISLVGINNRLKYYTDGTSEVMFR